MSFANFVAHLIPPAAVHIKIKNKNIDVQIVRIPTMKNTEIPATVIILVKMFAPSFSKKKTSLDKGLSIQKTCKESASRPQCWIIQYEIIMQQNSRSI